MATSVPHVRVGLLTREWPPDVYGGAGVHVEFLARELDRLVDLRVETFAAHGSWDRLDGANTALQVLATDLSMAAAVADRDLVHSHTWYANLGGHLAKLLHDVPHVMTSHSLEPRRPWKAEQLGGGYRISSWAEQTAIEAADAVIAVSAGMRADVLSAYPAVEPARVHVVHNGIDTSLFTPSPDPTVLGRLGLDPSRPVVIFIGRITRQKGLPHLLRAMRAVRRSAQLVLCASAPDTPQIEAEVETEVAALGAAGFDVIWLREPLPRDDLVRLLASATLFVCPSIYEPLGIVNLEAMACGIPVIASNVGGIPEVVDGGATGVLVPYVAGNATAYESGLANAIESLLDDPARAKDLGAAGRARAESDFSWPAIADQTLAIYQSVAG